jgi:hypothetical protein
VDLQPGIWSLPEAGQLDASSIAGPQWQDAVQDMFYAFAFARQPSRIAQQPDSMLLGAG